MSCRPLQPDTRHKTQDARLGTLSSAGQPPNTTRLGELLVGVTQPPRTRSPRVEGANKMSGLHMGKVVYANTAFGN